MVFDDLALRQIWATSTKTATLTADSLPPSAIPAAASALCTIALPAKGILHLNDTYSIVLTDTLTFESSCEDQNFHGCPNGGNSAVVKSFEPFYASVPPQIYALATATIISYILVILIFITPRTFYVGGPGGGANFLGLRSLVPGSGSSSIIGVGRRPLLQKIAAVTVAVSLTIASADTFRVAGKQYADGLMDSQQLVEEVISSTEIRVVRVVSDTFLWLAQVQTLIRLFPRHKEKVTIKWLGFALVTCDTVFSILENFVSDTTLTRPRNFSDAIPALSYLFQMSISLIYASCVIYYSLSKRRYAFWHSKMKNILLVAVISLTAVLIPVVFFVIDVSNSNIAVWGEYIRWVGAAAASVVVWEWVERIEALERDQRKDGILGREIFDGDEMVDTGDKSSSTYSKFKRGPPNDKVSMFPIPMVKPRIPWKRRESKPTDSAEPITRPPQVASPVSRSDTTSAASTVYQVRYQNVSSPSPAIPEEVIQPDTRPSIVEDQSRRPSQIPDDSRQVWQAVSNPFKRKRAEPPAEVAAQMGTRRSPAQTYQNLRDRLRNRKPASPMPVTVIPAQPRTQAQSRPASETSLRSRQSSKSKKENLPVTVIPPPVRGGRTWSPDDLAQAVTPEIHARGALTIAESPRVRDSPSGVSNRSVRLRTQTIDSLDDRISSTSPKQVERRSPAGGEQREQQIREEESDEEQRRENG